MRRQLLIRGALLAVVALLVGTAARQLRAKTADERVAEMYEIIWTGTSVHDLESNYGFPKSRAADPIEGLAIYNALYLQWPEGSKSIGGAEFDSPKQWLAFMQSQLVEWRVWQHPYDQRQWIAVAELDYGRGNRGVIYKLRCGF